MYIRELSAAALLAASLIAQAAEENTALLSGRFDSLREGGEQLGRQLRETDARLWTLDSPARGKGFGTSLPDLLAQSTVGGKPAAGGATATDEPVVREPKRSRSADNIYQEQGALFTNKFTLEPSVSYSRFDRRQINLSGFLALDAIFLGNISVDQSKADTLNFDLTARLGVTDRLQFDLSLPYIYRTTEFIAGGAGGGAANQLSEFRVTADGLGDVSAGAHYQLVKESGSTPDIVGNIRIKAPTGRHPYGVKVITPTGNTNLTVPTELPTGNGVWAAQVGLSFLKTLDPAIVFTNFALTHNFKKSFSDISSAQGVVTPGDIDLRNAIQWGGGIAFAVNERLGLSFAFSDLISERARTRTAGQNWQKIVGSNANAATFSVGVSYATSASSSIIASLGMGLTTDAPDYQVTLRFPFTW